MQSEKINPLAPILLEIQSNIKATPKTTENKFLKTHYADLGQVWETIKPFLTKHGLLVLQKTTFHDGFDFLETEILHVESGVSIKSEMRLHLRANDSQNMGSAITYARRYSLLTAFNMLTEDDDGNAASDHSENKLANGAKPDAASTQKAGKLRANSLREFMDANILGEKLANDTLKKYKVSQFEDLPKDVADKMIDHCKTLEPK